MGALSACYATLSGCYAKDLTPGPLMVTPLRVPNGKGRSEMVEKIILNVGFGGPYRMLRDPYMVLREGN